MVEKNCFVIAPIGEPDTDIRKRSDQVLKHVISPAMEECGYKATRADQISEPGMITSQVIQHIVDDPLVIADLTDRNPNVFYELALRHAIRKPLVQLIKKGEQIPFDVAGTRTIHVDHKDLDSVEDAKRDIIAQVKALETDPSIVETPISVSMDLQLLRQSDNPEQRSLADVLSALSEMRSSVSAMEKRLSNPAALIPEEFISFVMDKHSMRSSILSHSIVQIRHMIEDIVEIPIGSMSKEKRSEWEMRVHRLVKMLDKLSHEEMI